MAEVMPRIALVTSAEGASLDEDLPPLAEALRGAGADASVAVWDDDGVPWASFDLAVVRSTWDYANRRAEFLDWAAHVARVTRLRNHEPILRWNTDKHYLRELAARGVPIVPTHWIEPGDAASIPWTGDVVVKPAVSAGARDTARHDASGGETFDHVRRLQRAGRAVMVQPYLHRIDEAGETALVFIAGTYSHGFFKGPILREAPDFVAGLHAREDIRACKPSPAERHAAERVLDALPFPRAELLYARVDLAPGDDGEPWLLELETTEPSLYFALALGSASRMAHAILDAVR